jgi:Tol biopolymer transport system component
MNMRRMSVVGVALALIAALAGFWQSAHVAAQTGNNPQPFADPAFQQVWDRTDSLVAQGQAGRSWMWGPQPRAALHENMLESPGGQRLVQYFDKSRMEINDPSANPNGAFYVTNGLLTVELISGRMQIGASAYSPRYPACIPIAGDSDDANAPTYASFRTVASVAPGSGRTDPDRRGQVAIATLSRDGTVGSDSSKGTITAATYAYYEQTTQHNIPQVFWDFLNQSGPVRENGQVVTKQLIVPWFYASGYPVSDAYWARVKVAGAYQDVLIQAYERRVLTYNPSNPPAFQVEMGNIGLHYYDWRYNNAGVCAPGTVTPQVTETAGPSATPQASNTPGPSATPTTNPTATPGGPTPTAVPPTGKIAWVSTRSGRKDVWIMNADGLGAKNLTAGGSGANYDPAFSPDGSKIAFVSTRDGNPEIYVMAADGSGVTRLTNSSASDTHPTWSPNGARIAFVSDRTTNNDIWVMNASDGGSLVNITLQPGNDRDPAWGSDHIAFVSNRNGNDEIYTALSDGTALTQITDTPGHHNWLPAWLPDGKRLLFASNRDGALHIYSMRADGGEVVQVSTSSGEEFDPTWAPNRQWVAFTSNREGNFEIYISYPDGTNLRRLTIDSADDGHPTWH